MKTCHGIESLKETEPTKNGFRRFECKECGQIWFHGESGYFQMGRPRLGEDAMVVHTLRAHRWQSRSAREGNGRFVYQHNPQKEEE